LTFPSAPPDGPQIDGFPGERRGINRSFAAGRSIMALILREMSTRFGRTPGGYVWTILQPAGVIVLLAIAFSVLKANPSLGTSFLLFKATGFVFLTQFRGISQMVGESLRFSRPLLDYPGVSWIDALIARFLLNTVVMLLVSWIILHGIVIYEGISLMLNWPLILLATALSLSLSLGVGVLNCFLFMRFPIWQQAWSIVTAPLFLVSGVILLFEELPRNVQGLLWLNPVYHITGLVRAGFYSTYNPTYVSVPYVLACALIPLVVGLLLLRRFHRPLLEM
jgi:capsular polysaccharide transport system permease protein